MTEEQRSRLLGFEQKIELDGKSFGCYKPSELKPKAIDHGMIDIIDQINSTGWIATEFCCWGHPRRKHKEHDAYVVFVVGKQDLVRLYRDCLEVSLELTIHPNDQPLFRITRCIVGGNSGESSNFYKIGLHIDFYSLDTKDFPQQLAIRRRFFFLLAQKLNSCYTASNNDRVWLDHIRQIPSNLQDIDFWEELEITLEAPRLQGLACGLDILTKNLLPLRSKEDIPKEGWTYSYDTIGFAIPTKGFHNASLYVITQNYRSVLPDYVYMVKSSIQSKSSYS